MVGLLLNHTLCQLVANWCLFRLKRLGFAAVLSCAATGFTFLTAASFAEVRSWLTPELQ